MIGCSSLNKHRLKYKAAVSKKRLPEVYFRTMISYLRYLTLLSLLLIGCGTFAAHKIGGGPASHHAQRKYDEAVRKGDVIPSRSGKDDRK
jgi:hypothetical protein